ncbi:DoxX family protein [Chitinophaga sp. GCM10012297]|uniref:DoxX family protein n=1 Tax=Chitinophaga chungangae TaxID=2821488 RepID=A0ABS3YCC2_9BACT|nr:DoxX family protein [Chitinophaga chungangae]MBO9152330.1 DoxX family protein [Chitinophaga chungangae]
MKKTKIFYWIVTGLMAAFLGMGAFFDAISAPEAVKMISQDLGYPTYLVPFLGVAKLLGIIAILIPGFPRVKEWAYAGLMFDLIGATYSSLAVGEQPGATAFMLIPIAFVIASYLLYHKLRKEKLAQAGQSDVLFG